MLAFAEMTNAAHLRVLISGETKNIAQTAAASDCLKSYNAIILPPITILFGVSYLMSWDVRD
jgi:hypothetical protein